MGKVISIVNYKGGVGKTTVSYNFASLLASKGYKVLLIDFDGQGNLSSICGADISINDKNIITNLNDFMKDNIKEISRYKIKENLYISPCNILKEIWETNAISVMARETILKRLFDGAGIKNEFDYIIIDNPPSISLDFQNSLVASDEVIIVTEPSVTANDGVDNVKKEILSVKEFFNSDLKIAGILVNKVENRTNFDKGMIDIIKAIFGNDICVFNTYIPKSIRVAESQAMKKCIVDYELNNKVTESFINFTEEYLRGEL